jgi:uncharacterized membrane protein (DUF106 family)
MKTRYIIDIVIVSILVLTIIGVLVGLLVECNNKKLKDKEAFTSFKAIKPLYRNNSEDSSEEVEEYSSEEVEEYKSEEVEEYEGVC